MAAVLGLDDVALDRGRHPGQRVGERTDGRRQEGGGLRGDPLQRETVHELPSARVDQGRMDRAHDGDCCGGGCGRCRGASIGERRRGRASQSHGSYGCEDKKTFAHVCLQMGSIAAHYIYISAA